METGTAPLREPLSLGQVLNSSFKVFNTVFIRLLGFIFSFISVSILFLAVAIGIVLLARIMHFDATLFVAGFVFLYIIFTLVMNLAMIHRINAMVQAEAITSWDSFKVICKYLPNLIGAAIVGLIISFAVDFIFWKLIIPGLFLSLVLIIYYPLIVIDNNLWFIEAFVKAIKFTCKRIFQNIILFYIVLPIITLALYAAPFVIFWLLKSLILANIILTIAYISICLVVLLPAVYIMYNIVLCVQIYNIKISMGEETPDISV
jgi:hypothetical protein